MTNNDLHCPKCKGQHHPVDCTMDESKEVGEITRKALKYALLSLEYCFSNHPGDNKDHYVLDEAIAGCEVALSRFTQREIKLPEKKECPIHKSKVEKHCSKCVGRQYFNEAIDKIIELNKEEYES